MKIQFLFLVTALGMISSSLSLSVTADENERHLDKDDIAELVKAGKVKSIQAILALHKEAINGRLLDLDFENEDGVLVYELEVLRTDSVVYEIKIDATTGNWLEEEIED